MFLSRGKGGGNCDFGGLRGMCAKMKVSRNIGKHAACFFAAAGMLLGGADLTDAEAAAALLSVMILGG